MSVCILKVYLSSKGGEIWSRGGERPLYPPPPPPPPYVYVENISIYTYSPVYSYWN